MNGMLTAANKNVRSIGGDSANFYRSASSVDSVSQEIYSQQALYIYYTSTLPDLVQGTAISLMVAGILSLAFMGLAGLGAG